MPALTLEQGRRSSHRLHRARLGRPSAIAQPAAKAGIIKPVPVVSVGGDGSEGSKSVFSSIRTGRGRNHASLMEYVYEDFTAAMVYKRHDHTGCSSMTQIFLIFLYHRLVQRKMEAGESHPLLSMRGNIRSQWATKPMTAGEKSPHRRDKHFGRVPAVPKSVPCFCSGDA